MTIEQTQKIGILGNSVGGILAALSTGLEERILAGLFVVAGGGLTEIIAESTEKNLSLLRDLRFKEYQFQSIGDYYEMLDQKVTIDNLDFANFTGPKKVGFIISNSDKTVPTNTQYDLVKAWGNNKLIFKTAPSYLNHVATIVHASVWWTDDIVNFFEVNL